MFFLLTAFVSGMAVTVIELAATRLLAPFFGASLFVWTNVIGIILAGLALGYAIGGRFADRVTTARPLYHILGLAGVLAALAPLLMRPVGWLASLPAFFLSPTPVFLIFGSFLAATVLFFFPILLLGMTSPFLIAFLKRTTDTGVGTIAGRVFAWSTVGSILGVFLTGFYFLPFFGTRRTILGASVALLLLGVVGAGKRWAPMVLVALLLVIFPSSWFGPLRFSEGLLFERDSPYQYLRVNEQDGRRYLIFNEGGGIQSVWDPETLETGFYYDYLAPFPLLFPEDRPLRVLLLGLGGGTIPRIYETLFRDRAMTIDAVEIDPVVVDVARQYFALPEDRTRVHTADGRSFLSLTEQQYDLVILDAFTHQYYIPPHLATKEFFFLLSTRLAPDGVIVMNVDAVREESPLLQSLGATAQTVFPFVRAIPMPNSWSFLLVAGRNEILPEHFADSSSHSFLQATTTYVQEHLRSSSREFSGVVLTDDRAPTEFLTDTMFFRELLSSVII